MAPAVDAIRRITPADADAIVGLVMEGGLALCRYARDIECQAASARRRTQLKQGAA
jgi:hypothetical protein